MPPLELEPWTFLIEQAHSTQNQGHLPKRPTLPITQTPPGNSRYLMLISADRCRNHFGEQIYQTNDGTTEECPCELLFLLSDVIFSRPYFAVGKHHGGGQHASHHRQLVFQLSHLPQGCQMAEQLPDISNTFTSL